MSTFSKDVAIIMQNAMGHAVNIMLVKKGADVEPLEVVELAQKITDAVVQTALSVTTNPGNVDAAGKQVMRNFKKFTEK